jgi:SAM-dependent methyltransferase
MPKCRLCGADEKFQKVRAATVYGGKDEHNFWQCEKCDIVYLFPVPTEEEEKEFYFKEFEKFMSVRSGSDRDWSNAEAHIKSNQDQVERRYKFLEPHLREGADMLELGCSSGFMMNAFKDSGLNCTGIEPSGEFIEFLEKNGHKAYPALDDLKQAEPDQKFDLITHFFVLEHIRDPYTFFKETFELLKDGGKIIAEIPCVHDPLTSLYNVAAFEKFYWVVYHHFYYGVKSLSYVLDSLGLKYEIFPEHRYDLSNHITWMTEGRPGGQGRYNHVFSQELIELYKRDLKASWVCDDMFLIVYK